MILLLCGLSGAGKTTLANYVKNKLDKESIAIEVIDADIYRENISRDLGFSREDRFENISRLGSIAEAFSAQDIIPIIASITPYELMRKTIKDTYKEVKVIHIDCELNCLIKRDTKGLYKRALLADGDPQKIDNLSGINDPFETPDHPDLYINTYTSSVEESALKLYGFIKQNANIH